MAGHQPGRGGLGETMAEFVNRRRREVEHFGQEAEAAARDAYGRAIRTGGDLVLKTQGQVMRHGADLIGAQKPPAGVRAGSPAPNARGVATSRPAATRPPAVPPTRMTNNRQGGSWLDRSPTAKAMGGDAARLVGNAAGVVRGGVHTVEGVVDAAVFLGRLADPQDRFTSPPGHSAAEQLVGAGRGVVDYAQMGFADPQGVVRDVQAKAHQMRLNLDPGATPMASTFAGELRRNFDIGQNQGEFAFDAGSLLYGGAEAKALARIGKLSKGEGAAKYLARGVPPGTAEYFATPYKGIGHHAIAQRTVLPPWLGGGRVPSVISDSPLFVLKPRGISTGDFFERHVQVDPKYYGGKVPKRFGGGSWSGARLGWEKYGPIGRTWHGSPTPLKLAVGAGVAGTGAILDKTWHEVEEAPR